MKIKHYIIISLGALSLFSCNVTRNLPKDQYLLTKNRVAILNEPSLSRSERIKIDDITPYIRQRPNSRVLGLDTYVWFYNKSDSTKRSRSDSTKLNWKNNWLRKIGEKPVIYDSMQTLRTVDAMSIYMRGRGFFSSNVIAKADTIGKRVYVNYTITKGVPCRLRNISYDFQDKFLEPIVRKDSANTLIHTGDIFSVDVLQAERQRITDYLKNQGYYAFNINNISYIADSTIGVNLIDIKTIVRQRVEGFNPDTDEPIMVNNSIFRIKDIYVRTNYDPVLSVTDSSYYRYRDTIEYRGIHFIYKERMEIKPEVLYRAINLYPNYLYSSVAVKKSSDNLIRLNYFKSTSILFTEVTDTSQSNLVTFIDNPDTESHDKLNLDNYTRERFLICDIYCTPGNKQSYNLNLETSFTTNFYGLQGTAGYQNKNLFRGVEVFDLSVTARSELSRLEGVPNSFEFGGSVGFTFPRFVSPIKLDRYNKVINARTKAEVSINFQNRPFYNRVLLNMGYGYTWRNNKVSAFGVKPIDISVIKLNSVDDKFLEIILNPYLRNSFESQLLAGISASYAYNTQKQGVFANSFRFMLNGETSGNLVSLAARMFERPAADGYYKTFGIQFSQYARLSADASWRIVTGAKTSIAYRFFIGSGLAYGNSTSVPFERLFYAGGPISMRGWFPRTLGPGSALAPKDTAFPIQLANFKLETNLEYRFPIYSFFQGAVFADVGNIWFVGAGSYDPAEEFHINNFYRQLGFNTGAGLRMDFSFFLLRLDWGLKMHNPNSLPGERWIRNITMSQSTFNFGVGYPF